MVNKRRGVALIDVIIGSAMLAIGLAVVVSMSSRSLARQSNAERQITASWLADELLTMILVVGPDEYAKAYPSRDRFDAPFDNFTYSVVIEDQSEFMPLTVRATVSWEEAGGRRSIDIDTLIARRHGESVDRLPAESIDREERYWDAIEARDAQ